MKTPQPALSTTVTIIITVASVWLSFSLSADPQISLLRDATYEVSGIYIAKPFFHPDMPKGISCVGLRFHERNGIAGRLLSGTFVTLGLWAARLFMPDPGPEEGVVYQHRFHALVKQTVKNHKAGTSGVQHCAVAECDDIEAEIYQVMTEKPTNGCQLDLQFHFGGPGSDVSGFSAALYPWSWSFGKAGAWAFELGFEMADITVNIGSENIDSDNVSSKSFSYAAFGSPMRLLVPLMDERMYATVLWHFNWYTFSHGWGDLYDHNRSFTSPLDLSLTMNPAPRLFFRLGMSLGAFTSEGIGYRVEVGFRL